MLRRLAGFALIVATMACSSPMPVAAPGFDRKSVGRKELTALLSDNPTAAARRIKDQDEAKRLADEKAKLLAEEEADAKREAEEKARDEFVAKLETALAAADDALARKDFADAKKRANAVLALEPAGNAHAFGVLGDVALETKDYAGALALYRKGIAVAPDEGWIVARASQALDKLGRPKEGRDLLREFAANHHDKMDGDTYVALGWLEHEQGDTKKAEDAFRAAEKVSGGKHAEAFFGLALLAADKLDADEVERTLVGLFALEPERRLDVERDSAFFRMRLVPKVKALFSPAKMAEAKAAATAAASAAAAKKKKPGKPKP